MNAMPAMMPMPMPGMMPMMGGMMPMPGMMPMMGGMMPMPGMMPMMGGMMPMMTQMTCAMTPTGMTCEIMPMAGMNMDMFKECCERMMTMMGSGMPMMMMCGGMPMMMGTMAKK